MMKPQKTQCFKHILEFYIGNGKGVATARSILAYPIQLVQIQCKVARMHKETESLKGRNKHRSRACNVVH